jgi:RNA methyltransferase, TrmH family
MITSTSNERVKSVRALQSDRKTRHEARRFVLEGPNAIREALATTGTLESLFVTKDFAAGAEGTELLAQASRVQIDTQPVTDAVMKSMCETVTPQGILAVAPFPELPVAPNLSFALLLDGVSDPGNAGSILRLAAGAGVDLVCAMPHTVDLFSPKVVRGAMGAHFRVPLRLTTWEALKESIGDMPIFLADSGGGSTYFQINWTAACALIVSGEAHGPSNEARYAASSTVMIPMPGGMESLNVAMAASVLVYEMLRQRMVRNGETLPKNQPPA